MNFNSTNLVQHTIAKLAEDVWHNRSHFINLSNQILLSYRITLTHSKYDTREEIYVHYVVSSDRWWITISDEEVYNIDHNSLIFPEERKDIYEKITSWRHYAFGDLLVPAIARKIKECEKYMKPAKDGSQIFYYLWDTLPFYKFEGKPL